MKIGIIGRKGGFEGSIHNLLSLTIEGICEKLIQAGHFLYIEKGTFDNFKFTIGFYEDVNTFNYAISKFTQISENCDIAIVIGGDGTMLDAANRLSGPIDKTIPLIGVNQGRVGFITDIPREFAEEEIKEILDGFSIEDVRSMLRIDFASKVSASGTTCLKSRHALNDIVFNQVGGRVIEFNVFVDEVFAYQTRGDGLIIATPSGSTAYAMSAGGAILPPSAKVIEVIPMLPQTLSYRPMIIGEDCGVTVELVKGKAKVFADGNDVASIESGAIFTVTKSEKVVKFLHHRSFDYFATLRQKLNWHLNPGERT